MSTDSRSAAGLFSLKIPSSAPHQNLTQLSAETTMGDLSRQDGGSIETLKAFRDYRALKQTCDIISQENIILREQHDALQQRYNKLWEQFIDLNANLKEHKKVLKKDLKSFSGIILLSERIQSELSTPSQFFTLRDSVEKKVDCIINISRRKLEPGSATARALKKSGGSSLPHGTSARV